MTELVKTILDLVAEMREEEKKTERRPHYYKRNGKMVERSYPDYIYTDRYKELFFGEPIRSKKIFKCGECGKMFHYFDLEQWCCDFENDNYICSNCYEEGMGEDL